MNGAEQSELEELARGIRNLIQDNAKFLDKVMDDDFPLEDEEMPDEAEEFEEL